MRPKRPRPALESLESRTLPAVYVVGPGQAYATLGAVPWNNLQPGDHVDILWKATPYHEKINLSASGTAAAHIQINGIAGPQGQLPVLDGDGATSSPNSPHFGYTPLQDFGLIVIYHDQNSPAGYQPSYIDINNLQLQGAVGGSPYTGYDGDARTYTAGAGGIWTEGSADLTIHGCVITNNDNGVFAKSNGDPASTTDNITLDGNYLYNNGVANNFLYHDSYIEADGAVYQYNHYGPLRANADGNALKDRSAGTVIRYNYLFDGGHILDLVDAQDGAPVLTTLPSYHQTFVYGNVLVSDPNGPTYLVHYGGDSGTNSNYRNGTLYFYDNTVVDQADQSQRYRTNMFELDDGNQTVDARNNIFYNAPATSGADPTQFEFSINAGNINFGPNWVSPGWLTSESAELGNSYSGTITGTSNFVVDSANNPDFANLSTYDVHLASGSSLAVGKGGPLASAAATNFPVTSQYVYDEHGQARPNINDLGAFAYAASAPPAATSLVVSAVSSTTPAGAGWAVTITAANSSGATVTGYTGTVHFGGSDPQGVFPHDYTFTAADHGVHQFLVTLNTAGVQDVNVSDAADDLGPETVPVTVLPGHVSLSLSTVSVTPSVLLAGRQAVVKLTAVDAGGKQETTGGLSVTFGLSGTAGGTFGPVTDHNDGTYTATFTATANGTGTVTATIGGQAVTSTLPTLTVSPDVAPVIQPIGPVTRTHGQFPASVTVAASSPVGNALTYAATATGDSAPYDLQSQYQFTGVGFNVAGAAAYVLHSGQPGAGVGGYYLIRPSDGGLFAYDGSGSYAHSFATGTPVATLGANVYTDPSLLLNARAPVDYATLHNLEGHYQFTQQGAGYYTAGAPAFVLHAAANNAFGNPYYLIRPSDGALFAYDGSGFYPHSFANGSPVATLGADVYAHPNELLNAEATPALYGQLYQVNQQYDLQQPSGGFYTGNLGHQAQWLYSPVLNPYGENWYTLTLSADGTQSILRAWQGYQDSQIGAVVATFNTPAVYNNPAWLTGATALPDPAVAVSIDNTGKLSIGLPAGGYVGTFKVTVAVSDGFLSTSQTVSVTSTDAAPTVTVRQGTVTVPAGSDQSYAHGSFPQTYSVSTADADGDTVTASAAATSYGPLFALEQQFRFQGLGYMTAGATAYVLQAAGNNAFGNPYYLLRPSDGALFPYDGSGSYSNTTSGTPLATLGAVVYADPILLTDAQPPVDYATLYGVEQQYQFTSMGTRTVGGITALALHSNQPGPGVMGYYLLRADGALFPYDGSGSYNNTVSGTPLATLGPAVYANPALLTGAAAAPGLYAQLAQAEGRYDFTGVGYAIAGAPAYVLKAPLNNAAGNPYYLLRADGTVWAYDGSGSYAHTFANSANRVIALDPSVFADPAQLTGAKAPPAATGVTASLSGGTLTVSAPSSFVGTFQVTVTATDGILTTAQTFFVTATDTAPVPNGIAGQTASASGTPLHVALGATDAEGDPVTYAASAAGYSAAYDLQQQYHFQGAGLFTTADGVTAYVLQVAGSNPFGNPYYLLKSDGSVYAYDGSGSYGHSFAGPSNLLATLTPGVFSNPALLTAAQAPSAPAAALSVSGSTLTVNVSGLTPGTVFRVFVSAGDGAETTRVSFLVTVSA